MIGDGGPLHGLGEGSGECSTSVDLASRLTSEGGSAGVGGALAQQQCQTDILADAALCRVADGERVGVGGVGGGGGCVGIPRRRRRRRRQARDFDVVVDDDRVAFNVVVDVHDVVVDVVDDNVVSAFIVVVDELLGGRLHLRRVNRLDEPHPGHAFYFFLQIALHFALDGKRRQGLSLS